MHGKFDTLAERLLYEAIAKFKPEEQGYSLVLKPVVGRYTLDMALRGKVPIDIECDGVQHEIIDGLPVIEDVERDRYLADRGWRIVRVPNYRILSDPNKAALSVFEAVSKILAQPVDV